MLEQIAFSKRLGKDQSEALDALAFPQTFNAGETIFLEGERHPFVYWIIEGQVGLEMASSGKTMRSLLTVGDGEFLAWSVLLTRRRMTATAKTVQPTRMLRFEIEPLLHLCESNHEIGYRVMQDIAGQLARRLLAARLQMLDLFQNPAHFQSEVSP